MAVKRKRKVKKAWISLLVKQEMYASEPELRKLFESSSGWKAKDDSKEGGPLGLTSDEARHKSQCKSFATLEATDIFVKCGDRVWSCSNLHLAERCEFFRAICIGSWMESASRIVHLPDDDPLAIDMIIDYLHHGKCSHIYSVQQAIGVFIAADKYDIPKLRDDAALYLLQAAKQISIFARLNSTDKAETVRLIREIWSLSLDEHDEIYTAMMDGLRDGYGGLKHEPLLQEFMARDVEFAKFFAELVSENDGYWKEAWNTVTARRKARFLPGPSWWGGNKPRICDTEVCKLCDDK